MGGGRNRSSRTQRKHFKEGRENVWKRTKSDSEQQDNQDDNNSTNPDENRNNPSNKPSWEPFTTQNPSFDEYYTEQGIVPVEEWDAFMECLRTALPSAFRINSSSPFHEDIRSQMENDFMKSVQEGTDGSEMEAIRPLPWYPDNLAWHSNFSRKQLRKNQTLERFHSFLKLENETGNITRQEAVSMVPPLFLDVLPDHFVLDMCAAPGSKTFQLLEMIHQLTSPGSLPSGLVVANDVDVQRCNLLIHQTKRMSTANLVVTTHEAQHFPGCHRHRSCENASESRILKKPDISQLLFDRVLCDVPCSGDGTLRKAPDIWRKWNPGMGSGLHGLQILIAMRGLSLLKVGGRMVYSTCSMNPIENEAVVAEILRRCKGSVELVDVSSELPQLVRRPGLKKWKVRDKGLWLNSYRDVPENRKGAVVPGMFPTGRTFEELTEHDRAISIGELCTNIDNGSSGDGIQSEEDLVAKTDCLDVEESTLPLELCMRIVPHDQNTGAFFIAVLQKLSALPASQKKPLKTNGKLGSNNNEQAQKATSEMKEETDNVEGTDGLVSEADIQVDGTVSLTSLNNDEMVESALDTDPSIPSEEIELRDIRPSNGNKAGPEVVGEKRKLQIQGRWIGVDPVLFYKAEDVISKIKEFYGIKESFPFDGHLVCRNSDTNHVKRIYYVANSVKEVLELNFQAGQQLKIASVGVKMFERQTSKEGTASPCLFRISSEGLPLILPHVTKQIIHASKVDFKHLLQYKSIKFADFTDPEFRNQAPNLSMGCCIVVLIKDNQKASDPYQVDASSIAIGCWRGKNSISVMVTAIDCQELLERMPLETDSTSLEEIKSSSTEAVEGIEEMKDVETKEEN